jgi:hypothetical protein
MHQAKEKTRGFFLSEQKGFKGLKVSKYERLSLRRKYSRKKFFQATLQATIFEKSGLSLYHSQQIQ